jgi:hypothetical protein
MSSGQSDIPYAILAELNFTLHFDEKFGIKKIQKFSVRILQVFCSYQLSSSMAITTRHRLSGRTGLRKLAKDGLIDVPRRPQEMNAAIAYLPAASDLSILFIVQCIPKHRVLIRLSFS